MQNLVSGKSFFRYRWMKSCVSSCIVRVLYRRVEVVENGIQFDPPVFDGFQAEQCVVDTAQFAGSDKQQRVSLLRNIVNRQQFVGKRHHQASGSLEQDNVVTAAQLFCSTFYFVKVDGTSVYA